MIIARMDPQSPRAERALAPSPPPSESAPLPRRVQLGLWGPSPGAERVREVVDLLLALPNDLLPLGVRLASQTATDAGTWLDVYGEAGRIEGVPVRHVLRPCKQVAATRAHDRALYMIKHRTSHSYPEIAAICGLRDHVAVKDAVDRHGRADGPHAPPTGVDRMLAAAGYEWPARAPLPLETVEPPRPFLPASLAALEARLRLWRLPGPEAPSKAHGPSWLAVAAAIAEAEGTDPVAVLRTRARGAKNGATDPELLGRTRHRLYHVLATYGGYGRTEIAHVLGVAPATVSFGIRKERS